MSVRNKAWSDVSNAPPVQEFSSSRGGLIAQALVDAINYYVPNSLEIRDLEKINSFGLRESGVSIVHSATQKPLLGVTQMRRGLVYRVSASYYGHCNTEDGLLSNDGLHPESEVVVGSSGQCLGSELFDKVERELRATLPSDLRDEYDRLNFPVPELSLPFLK